RPNGKRSQTQSDDPESKGKSRPPKKGSQHADVIDRLDFTGVGQMFHHDGPFDACAPSRNKHRNKAPLYAWGTQELPAPQYGDSAYPAASAYKAFTQQDYPEPPKKKVDAIAEAWGIHEPEPFEEFFAGGGTGRADGDTPTSSIYNGRDTSRGAPSSSRRPQDPTKDPRARMAARRSVVPPPQPIFVGEPSDMEYTPSGTGSPPASSPGFPKRSKSIMHRIRKMRDAPNVPVGNDYEPPPPPSPSSPTDPTPSSPRPGHRAQNSFLGRFAGGQGHSKGHNQPQQSPPAEPFVLIETTTAASTNKDLPAPPPVLEESTSGDYFEQPPTGSSPPGGTGVGRRSSLMKKVGRVVRGTK
ncbi:Pal1-domain-containing protein, partial [Pholiota conissans]